MNPSASITKIILADITANEQEPLILFCTSVCKTVSRAYIETRISRYDYAISYYTDNKLTAVQFVDQFTESVNTYFYLGPLFSVNTAFLPLFISWLQQEWKAGNTGETYLTAEFQNPELFLFFKVLFNDHSFPSLESNFIPEKIKEAALRYAKNISHITGLNPDNLSSLSQETLYTLKKRDGSLIKWMKSRGVYLQEHQNQLLVVCLPNALRTGILQELQLSLNKTERNKLFTYLKTR